MYREEGNKLFMVGWKQRWKGNYVVYWLERPIAHIKYGSTYVCNYRSNFLGTCFDIECLINNQIIGRIEYEPNILGYNGPRKMTVRMPRLGSSEMRLVLRNKQPQWSESTQSYVLNFGGRVTQASVKNFQIIHPDDGKSIIKN